MPSVASRAGWEHFSHDADVGVRGFGATPAQAFEQAALALTAVVTRAQVEALSPIEVRCEAPDLELLFVDWLNAIIYEMAVRRMLFARFDVRVEDTRLAATAWGEPVSVARHAPAVNQRARPTRHYGWHSGTDGFWSAACVVDV